MIDQRHQSRIINKFPFLNKMRSQFKESFFKSISVYKFEKGQIILGNQESCHGLPLVIEGSIRVYQISKDAKEITLYRIEAGSSCVITATCIMNKSMFPAVAVAEETTQIALVPENFFRKKVEEDSAWRDFLFELYGDRLSNMFSLIEEVAFNRVDERLTAYLKKKFLISSALKTTHQDLADEIGSSREVVSRILKDFEKRGIISLKRGEIIKEKDFF